MAKNIGQFLWGLTTGVVGAFSVSVFILWTIGAGVYT